MSYWNPRSTTCLSCLSSLMADIAEQDGEHILWCPNCGTLLTANKFDPISAQDWHTPKSAEKLDGSSRRYKITTPKEK